MLTPLGFHLPQSDKDKILKGEFLELLSLLLSSKELAASAKKSDDKEEERKRTYPRSFQIGYKRSVFMQQFYLRSNLQDYSSILILSRTLIRILVACPGILIMNYFAKSWRFILR